MYGDIMSADIDMYIEVDKHKDKDIDVYKNADFCSRQIHVTQK
jgi:hypothetical protein